MDIQNEAIIAESAMKKAVIGVVVMSAIALVAVFVFSSKSGKKVNTDDGHSVQSFVDTSPIDEAPYPKDNIAREKLIETTALLITSKIDHRLSEIGEFVYADIQRSMDEFLKGEKITDLSQKELTERLMKSFDSFDDRKLEDQINASLKACILDIDSIEESLSNKLKIASKAKSSLSVKRRNEAIDSIYKSMIHDLHQEILKKRATDVASFAIGKIASKIPVPIAKAPKMDMVIEYVVQKAAKYIIHQISSGEPHDVVMQRIIREGSANLTSLIQKSLTRELYAYGLERMKLYQDQKLTP